MIYLILAITASTLILISFKIFEKLGIDSYMAITVNYIIGAIFGYNYIGWHISFQEVIGAEWFPMSALTGLVLIIGFVLFSLSAQKAGVAITAISSRMAVIISVVLGILVFGDSAGYIKISGVCLAIIAFYLTFKKGRLEKPGFFVLLLPLAVFLFMGLNDIVLKVTQYYYLGSNNETGLVTYAATSFFFGFLIGIPVLMVRSYHKRQTINTKSFLGGILLGLLNWFSTYYLLKGLSVMEVSVFIPLLNVSVVSISALAGYFVFREKLRLLNWIGIGLALLAIVLISGT